MNNPNHPVTSAPQYLQVKVPQTTNGVLLAYDSNQQPIYKTVNLPLSAKKRLEQKNTRLPTHLRTTITVVTNQPPIPYVSQLHDQSVNSTATVSDSPAKNKGGRPSKTQSNETK